jgi:anti-sigma B factor antagonist
MAPGSDDTITVVRHPPDAVIVLTGEVDIATTPAFDDAVQEVTTVGTTDLTIDLSAVTFIGSTGLASLLKAQRAVEDAGGRFSLASPSRSVVDLLHMTHLDQRFELS